VGVTDELDAIEARANAASEGPWVVVENALFAGDIEEARAMGYLDVHGPGIHLYNEGALANEDADFIAHARTDVPALVAELRQVRQERANLKQMLSQCEGDAQRMQLLISRLHGLLEGGLTYDQSELRQDVLEMLGLDDE